MIEHARQARKIARFTSWQTRRAYRDVGPMTAAEVAVEVPWYLLKMYYRDRIKQQFVDGDLDDEEFEAQLEDVLAEVDG